MIDFLKLVYSSCSRHRALLILGLCLVILLPGMNSLTVMHKQELRVTLTAANMANGGSWLIPEFQGAPRLRKPPLLYWLVASSYRLAGDATSAGAARLPVTIMATILALSLYGCGAGLIGRRNAFLAGLVLVSSHLFTRYARLTETDIPLTLFTTLAIFSCYQALTKPKAMRWWIAAGLCMGCGFMMKGPAAMALPSLAALIFWISEYRKKTRNRLPTGPLLAFSLFLLLVLPWYIAIWHHPAAQAHFGGEINETFINADHPEPIIFYGYMLPLGLMPWGLLLPFALWHTWHHLRHHRSIRFILIWWISSFLTLTLTPNRQIQYTVLLLPSSALLIGMFLRCAFLHRPSWQAAMSQRYLVVLSYLLSIVTGIAMLAFALYDHDAHPAILIALCLIALGIAAWHIHLRHAPKQALIITLIALCLINVAYVYVFHRIERTKSLIPQFAEAAQPYLTHSESGHAVGYGLLSIEFYTGIPLIEETDLTTAWEQAMPGDAVILSLKKDKTIEDFALPAVPCVDSVWRGARCLLFIKPDQP